MKGKVKVYLSHAFLILCLLGALGCHTGSKPGIYSMPQPEDTHDRDIAYQEKRHYTIDDITVSNMFDGARMNDFQKVDDRTYRVVVSPENSPINESAYYAFKIWSEKEREIDLEIFYTEHPHRYWPKLNYDGRNWMRMDSSLVDTLKAGNLATLKLTVGPDTLTVAGQELYPSAHALNWTDSLAKRHAYVRAGIAGTSKLKRDILYLDIYEGRAEDKPAIAVFSRLHPPEVPGYLAMLAFVETITDTTVLATKFRQKYRTIVYPMVNPDGVDLGHWRHNAGGIDLNRDWSHYRQPETRAVAEHLTALVDESDIDVVLGIDFHSTQEDLYYTLTDNRQSDIYPFKDLWLDAIDAAFDEYTPKDEPFDLSQPITKAWFFLEFNAEGITYEVGDETPREFVKAKAEVAAREMMKFLVLRQD